jgi:hypothetical protein
VTTEVLLFALRIASAVALLSFLGLMFWIMWRDFRVVSEPGNSRRTYGRIVRVQETASGYAPLEESFALMPLTSFGRSPTNSIPINDTFASNDHAVVALRSGRWWLEDHQSTNGTLLNGIPIDQAVIITDGDIISIGQSHFRLELET